MIHSFTQSLLTWFSLYGRALPWRGTRDAYAIWLSEVILQQTRIVQGEAYWHRFMQRFPDVGALAAASEDEVLRLWQGLGYYSRARNLHAAARQIMELGAFPQTIEGIRSLKGVGDYTAAAVGSIAFGLDAAAVDGNVYRVLARYFGIDTPINTTGGKREFTALASALLPHGEAGTFNQALMDFGALQCTPQSPRCDTCPLVESCEARRSGRTGELPVKLRKTQVRQRRLVYIYIRCKGFTALHRRGPGDIWQGLWEPLDGESENEVIKQLKNEAVLLVQDMKHVLTHRILLADFYFVEVTNKPALPEDYIWVPEAALVDYAKPRLIEKLLETIPQSLP